MEITEVRVSLRENPQTRLKAYATITFDHCFVVRNVKVIEGRNGLFVAMPSRKPKVSCPNCHVKNDLTNRHCCQCGTGLTRPAPQAPVAGVGELEATEALAHRDIAHPITVEFRQYLQKKVLDAYESQKAGGGSGRGPGEDEAEYETL